MTRRTHDLVCEYLVKLCAAKAVEKLPEDVSDEERAQAYHEGIVAATVKLIQEGVITRTPTGHYNYVDLSDWTTWNLFDEDAA